ACHRSAEYKNIFHPDAEDKKVLYLSRVTVVAVALIAIAIAWDKESSIMNLVSDAWAGLGAAFGPLVVCSIFWKRTTLSGAIAGILSGGMFVIIWDYIPMIQGTVEEEGGMVVQSMTLYEKTGIYSLLLGFFFSLICIVIVSLISKKPDQEILDEYDRVKNYSEEEAA
ncbi:MAG: hypothetical protein K5639_01850, partial [Eubacterium sp.]|nr:hypothetical protein [Eubacterium sp.]